MSFKNKTKTLSLSHQDACLFWLYNLVVIVFFQFFFVRWFYFRFSYNIDKKENKNNNTDVDFEWQDDDNVKNIKAWSQKRILRFQECVCDIRICQNEPHHRQYHVNVKCCNEMLSSILSISTYQYIIIMTTCTIYKTVIIIINLKLLETKTFEEKHENYINTTWANINKTKLKNINLLEW